LNPNTIFENISKVNFAKIKEDLKSRFSLIDRQLQQGMTDTFEIKTTEGRINFTYYSNGKLMIQSSPSNTVYTKMVLDISKSFSLEPVEKIEFQPKEESEMINEYYIGCDEAGAGESFGSMFLGCAIIYKDQLDIICNIVKGKNMRELKKQEIIQILNAIDGTYQSNLKIYSACDIDNNTKNILLDRGYIELISKTIMEKSNVSVIIDDYGIRPEMMKFVNDLKKKEIEVIVKTKADEEYTAVKIASLVARKARLEEIEHTNSEYVMVDKEKQEMIFPESGSASNPNTVRYLIEFRKRNPYAEFPPFVRKKWKNVQEIEKKYPRQSSGLFVKCHYCSAELTRIDVQYDKQKGSKLYCTKCANLIAVSHFQAYFNKNLITLDTSTLISRIVSKDLKSNCYFKNNCFLIPTFVYDELDTKQPDKKKGGLNEISALSEFKRQGIIGFDDVDTHTLAHGVANDKKLLKVLDTRNATLLTKDANMASFAEIDHFVFYISGN